MTDLIDRLRAFAKRYEFRSVERTIMLQAAEALEASQTADKTEVTQAIVSNGHITVEAVESIMGSKLLPWQVKKLNEALSPPVTIVS